MKIFVLALGALLCASLCMAESLELKKLCGPGRMRDAMTGSLFIDGAKGHVTADVVPSSAHLDENFRVDRILPLTIPRDEPRFIQMLERLGVRQPQDGTIYEMTAVDADGKPKRMVLSRDGSGKDDGYLHVSVMPYEGGRKFVTLSFRENGYERPFAFFYGTSDCGGDAAR